MDSLTKKRGAVFGNHGIDLNAVRRAYRRYAGVYDLLFGAIFESGRRAAVGLINELGCKRVLEVGVGTGLSLPAYRRDSRVIGIDVCSEMLARARQRVAGLNLPQVAGLQEMDAQDMDFPDESFDAVVAMYVLSVVPNPERLLSEMQRVCVPGGEIIVVNHFASEHCLARLFERAAAPLSATIGFRPDLDLKGLIELADMEVVETRDTNLFGGWKLLRFRNRARISEPKRAVARASAR